MDSCGLPRLRLVPLTTDQRCGTLSPRNASGDTLGSQSVGEGSSTSGCPLIAPPRRLKSEFHKKLRKAIHREGLLVLEQ